jgi:(S)-3,5-dihydroxyphenylglycine transaminase
MILPPEVSSVQLADLHGSLRDPLLDTMNFLNEVTARFPDAISFAPGRPYDEPFDTAVIAGYLDAYTKHLERDRGLTQRQVGGLLFQYGRTKGQIHDLVAATIANDEGIEVPPESIVVTVGAQEGMLLALRALIRDGGDVLLVGSPCYVGITGAARLLDVAVEPVPEGPAGVTAEAVREAAARVRATGRRPRALYVVPDFANPSGTSMPVAARRELLAAAGAEDVYVLEDNPYGLFSRTGARVPTLKALDREGRVVYLGSFAKSCFPGARVGYVVADQPVVAPGGATTLLADELSKIKSMTTVNTSPLAQAVIGGMLVTYGCRLRVANAERVLRYRERLDALLAALDRHLGAEPGVGWNVPDGGFFLVLSVPFIADASALTRSARDHGVLWTPMSYFYPEGGGEHHLRLSCSYLNPADIDEGVARLASFITTNRPPHTARAPRTTHP